ncbi:MAG: PucR family transcriptional regulator, partial [Pseudonocardiaceae bacterium]
MSNPAESVDAEITVPLRTVVDNVELALEVVPESLRPGALDLPVRWAHVSELLDPAPYLLGQELLLTAGVNLPQSPDGVDRYVRGLRSAGITALGFGITPPMHEVLPDPLRQACARHGLALLVAPTTTPFLAVSRAVSLAISQAGQREQRRITAAREALTKLATGGSGEVARGLAQRISGWVALVGADDELAAEHRAPWPLPAEVGALLSRLRAGSGIRSATTELADGTFVLAQPVYPQATASRLLIVGRTRRLDSTDRAILGVGAGLLGLIGRAGSDTARIGGATTSWLLDGSPSDEVLADLVSGRDFRLAAGVAYGSGPPEAEAGYEWLRSRLATPLIHLADGPSFTAILGSPPTAEIVGELHAAGWLVAVGGHLAADRLPEALPEVRALLQRAVALGKPAVARSRDGLSALVPPDVAATYAHRTLGPVSRLDAQRGEDLLIPTLRAWLAHHGGWDRTASALGVHRNSVRNRIGQIERALGVDLADPETRMELWFALR